MIVQRFLHWLDTAPNSSRADAAAALARARLYTDMSEKECDAADAALTLLLDDPASKVRFAIADVLASHAKAPRHMIMALAKDQAEIAMLVLCRSPLFLDSELIDTVSGGDTTAVMAIACRQPLSNEVARAIVGVENSAACLALLQNTSIKLDVENLRAIANCHGSQAEIREALLSQACLPAGIRQTLIAELSLALKQLVLKKSWLSEVRAKKVTRDACDRSTALLANQIPVEEIPQLVEHLRSSKQLTAAFLLRTICAGNLAMFTAAIANLTEIPENRIIAVLQQGRTAAFRAIYDRSDLPQSAIPAITAAIDIWRDEADAANYSDNVQVQRRVVDRIIAQYLSSARSPNNNLLALLHRIASEVTRDAALLRAREISTAA